MEAGASGAGDQAAATAAVASPSTLPPPPRPPNTREAAAPAPATTSASASSTTSPATEAAEAGYHPPGVTLEPAPSNQQLPRAEGSVLPAASATEGARLFPMGDPPPRSQAFKAYFNEPSSATAPAREGAAPSNEPAAG